MPLTRDQIIQHLLSEGEQMEQLFAQAGALKRAVVGEKLYLRGLIEYTNRCRKSCLYCGIRAPKRDVQRYTLSDEEVLSAARYAYESGWGSVVLQGGELCSQVHTSRIESLLRRIKELSRGELGITLSLGEQSEATYRRWFEAGAHRYLLRIEASTKERYEALHPHDNRHRYEDRLEALRALRRVGYQVGSGVMIGLPGQSVEDMADDLCFLCDLGVDMCGMGPYVLSEGTPMALQATQLPTLQQRLEMSLKMIATLRLMVPDLNIVASTALASLSEQGRVKAVECGANILMPNITPTLYREHYALYNDKSSAWDQRLAEYPIGWGEWGDAPHFRRSENS